MRNAAHLKILHADATNKVTVENLPLIVIGASDANGQFHPIGFGLSTNETSDDYVFMFKSMKDGILQFTSESIEPTHLVADADPAIHNGFRKIFGDDAKIIMCYAHVMGNIDRKYAFASLENKEELKNDIRKLHLSANEAIFDIGCQLFIEKWSDKEKDVVRKIEKSFFNKNKKWFIGCASKVPKTNNLLERFNGKIKQFQTFHERKPVKHFLKMMLKITAQRSREYIMDKKPFESELQIDEEQLRDGCEYVANFVSSDERSSGEIEFFVHASITDKDKITREEVLKYQNELYTDFNHFAANHCTIWKIVFPRDSSEWKKANCTCPSFDDKYICKHVISIAHQLGLVEMTAPDYDDEPLFQSVRGRPKKASKNPLSRD